MPKSNEKKARYTWSDPLRITFKCGQNFNISNLWKCKKFWNRYLASFLGSRATFETLLCLNYSPLDVSTIFPASFFTVMPKGLITGPKSSLDYSSTNATHDPCGIAFSCRQNAKKGFDKKPCTLGLKVSRPAKNRIFSPRKCRICNTGNHVTLNRGSLETWVNVFSEHQKA
jgi:hypothetical protein